jgi:hypothetical protein
MHRTTVYLPESLKRALERLAATRRCSEAELLREAVTALVAASAPPAPTLPLFESKQPDLAENVDAALTGFGEE